MINYTTLKPKKPIWLIVRHGQFSVYPTGKIDIRIALVEFDTVSELDGFVEDESVNSGESEGNYLFEILGQSHTWNMIDNIRDDEKNGEGD